MHLPSICCYTFLRKKRKFFSLASNVNSVTFRCCSTLLLFALFLFDYLYVVNISSALCKHILHTHTHTWAHTLTRCCCSSSLCVIVSGSFPNGVARVSYELELMQRQRRAEQQEWNTREGTGKKSSAGQQKINCIQFERS